jgi:FkbM family methyltransferase
MNHKLKNLIKRIIFKFFKPLIQVKYIQNAYSQAGEDLILEFLFNSVSITNPTYLDIGVYYPDRLSNTQLFYMNGSRGVCVEADETLIPVIKELRPEDVILNIGIGVNEMPEAEFYIFNEKGLNTFDKKEAEYRESFGTFNIERVSKVQLRPINSIIKENFNTYPDLLSIDIEGLDLDVLKTLDFIKFPVPVICVETCTYSETHIKPKDFRIIEFMISMGYFVYADTYINTIFVNANWFNGVNKK